MRKKTNFENLDQTANLDENLTQFWALCGQNRDIGVTSILANELVTFKNVRTYESEEEEIPKDIKSLKKEICDMISVIPSDDKMKDYFKTVFKQEVSNSTNLEQVEELEFYWLLKNNCDITSDSESDESLYDELSV